MKVNFDFHVIVRKSICDTVFKLKRYLILLYMTSYFSEKNKTKYLVPSYILINPSILPNLIRRGFKPIKFLYKMS